MTDYPVPPRELTFRTSSFSNDQQGCVEVGDDADGGRWVRDTKDRTRPAHYYTPIEWAAFLNGVKAGEFD